ncbi:MAG: 5-formyltetrahydrofolate cyclo-ligase [Nitrospirota bacterium]|nr:5-formyltetrahydrofolate cyclo-ligase [Nitrospirota bacterium]
MKSAIRKKVLDERFALTPEERRARSRAIEQRLFSLPEFEAAAVVLFFASFQSEVETHFMIRRALAEGKRVVLPKVKGKELVLLEIANFDKDMLPGAWGIPEPERGTPVPLADIGLIVVPGAVFDEQGNRVGYGAGYYDRLLPAYSGPTVALAFELQVLPSVPVDDHDIPVKRIVTENRVLVVNK